MALGKLPVPGRPTIWMTVGQGPIALAVGAGGGCVDIFTLHHLFSPLSPALWETTRYKLKYCLKGPLNPKTPTNQPIKLPYLFPGPVLKVVICGKFKNLNKIKKKISLKFHRLLIFVILNSLKCKNRGTCCLKSVLIQRDQREFLRAKI